jgi:hypothetical protein
MMKKENRMTKVYYYQAPVEHREIAKAQRRDPGGMIRTTPEC